MPGGITLLASAPGDIPTPPAGKVTIFFNTSTNEPAYKNELGIVNPLEGPAGPQGPEGPPGFAIDGDDGDPPIALPGPQGNPGITGPQGPAGPAILFISEGEQGEDGIPGPAGASANGGSDWDQEVIKLVDESVTDSAVQNDDELFFLSLTANATYLVDFNIIYSGNNTTGDYAWNFFYFTSGVNNLINAAQAIGWYINPTSSLASANPLGAIASISGNSIWPNAAVTAGVTAAGDKFNIFGMFQITLNATGSIRFQFGNGSAAAGRTSTTHAGSRLRLKKISL